MIRYSVFTSPWHIRGACALIKKYKLYVPHWRFSQWIKHPEYLQRIVIARHDGVPVGCGITHNDCYGAPNTGTFVLERERRNGIGTGILTRLSKDSHIPIQCATGIIESVKFFSKCRYVGIQFGMPYTNLDPYEQKEEIDKLVTATG